jgi:alanine dehydrogenase
MPGAVPRTSTFALNNATLPFVEAIADQGWEAAMRNNVHMRNGLNVHRGQMVNEAAANALGLNWLSFEKALA